MSKRVHSVKTPCIPGDNLYVLYKQTPKCPNGIRKLVCTKVEIVSNDANMPKLKIRAKTEVGSHLYEFSDDDFNRRVFTSEADAVDYRAGKLVGLDKIIKAANVLREYCDGRDCKDCMLDNIISCAFGTWEPHSWDIPKPCEVGIDCSGTDDFGCKDCIKHDQT